MNTPGYNARICIREGDNYFYYYTGKNHYADTNCNWKYWGKWKVIDGRIAKMFLENDQADLWDGKSTPAKAKKLRRVKCGH